MAQFQIEVFRSLQEAEPVWRQFQAQGTYYAFQDFRWLTRWQTHIGPLDDGEPCIVTIRCTQPEGEAQPLMLIPFIIQKSGPLRILKLMGGEVSDYFSPIMVTQNLPPEPDWFVNLWPDIKAALPPFDAARLLKLPTHIEALDNPLLQLPSRFYAESHSASLTDDWETFYTRQIKKKIRADSRRQRKRVAELGELRFVIAETPEQYRAITETMIQHKQRRYAETEVTDLLAREHYRQFYLDSRDALGPDALIHVSALYVGDEIVATHWGAVLGSRYYFLMPTYADGDWKRYSVGRILLEELMAWCFEQGLSTFDFSLGGEQYKREWCDRMMPLHEVLDANSLKGQLYVAAQRAKKRILSNPDVLRLALKVKNRLERQ